ncbi:MAG TPA: transporter [Cytophagales bacterium]|jgi:uncharacterized membrane protein YedE/YeeE|nr:transporter [Cytophagales bacterium]
MNFFRYLLIGILFGMVMSMAEIVSWYRIYEMFRFGSFHMYGIIGSAIVLGIIIVQVIKRKRLRSIEGVEIRFNPKNKSIPRYLIGGIIFGLGWALTGACPGPMFVLAGHGVDVIWVVIFGAVAGTFTYGLVRAKLPH